MVGATDWGTLAFGVGCYHFRPASSPPYKLTVSDYGESVRRSLASIPNVENVDLWLPDEEAEMIVESDQAITEIERATGAFAAPDVGRVDFELRLPSRTQQEILGRDAEWNPPETATYFVTILYEFYLPVAFVRAASPNVERPSMGVRIVREFLRKELPLHSTEVSFECLGPSPFWADMHIIGDDLESAVAWTSQREFLHGYDRIQFKANASRFANAAVAYDYLIFDLARELSLYYFVVQAGARHMLEWGEIEGLADQLATRYERQGVIGFLRRAFLTSRGLNSVGMRLARYQMDALTDDSGPESAIRSSYGKGLQEAFKSDVTAERIGSFKAPTAELAQLLDLLERRHSKRTDILTLVASSLIGGVGGSLITLAATK